MRKASIALASALALAGAFVAGERRTQAKAPEPAPSCGQRGRVTFDKDTTLSDQAGKKLARFSGGESAVTLLSPPKDGSDLARIETGTGRGSFRITGYVKSAELRIYTSYAVPVVTGHVWLGVGTRVVAAGSSGGKVKIDKQVSSPFNQRFSAQAECSALTFTPPTAPGFAMPGSARVYLLKNSLLDLYSDAPPSGGGITTLQRSPLVDSVRFFSTEQKNGYVHLQYQGEVNIDAWAKASELSALPQGETSDLPPGSYTMSTPPQLQLQKTPRIVKTTRDLPLRVAAREADAAIGVVEAETEVYVMDTVAGWANVLPKSLHVLPADNLSFWVKSSELGI